ncbi:MAG TPA: hypothetical protein VKS79_21290 [Gemmataceae bacterium]|nr:hypothetical protein [Gemmataceae bacterium]
MGRPTHHFDKKIFRYLVEAQDALPVLNQQTVRQSREMTAAVWHLTLDELGAIERRGMRLGWLDAIDKKREKEAVPA